MSLLPVYNGGDATVSPFLSINKPPSMPVDTPTAFFTGKGNYLMTKQYASRFNLPYIAYEKKVYKNVDNIETAYIEPWAERVMLNGTDGSQFHPDIQETDFLYAFAYDLCYISTFDFNTSSTEMYPNLKVAKFDLNVDALKS